MPLLVLICLVALGVVVVLALRLRAVSAALAGLRAQSRRDAQALADARREESDALTGVAGDLARARGELEDVRAALAAAQAERDLAREDAEVARRQRYTFLAGLAHDLRNPLAPLSNGIELLRLTDNDPAGRLRTRGIMERQVGNLMRIADELSDLARLAGGGAPLQDAAFDVGAMLRAAAERVAPALQAQEAALAIAPGLGNLSPLHGDEQRLAQAVGYLVTDLVRHAERGSTVRIAGGVAGGDLELVVAVAADLDPPEPPDPPALDEVDASALGLGISLADQLIRLHRGRLRARRPPGARRARFTVTLPLAPQDAAHAASPTPRARPPAKPDDAALTVLLADDNVDFSHSFGTMLELLGHRVEIVHDGLAAVASIVGAPPDIAFVDIGMPALDGVETVRRVRGQGNTQDVLLVAVTGRGGAEDRARAAEAGFDRYLVKPFAMRDVRDALDAAQAIRSGAASRAPGPFASTHAG